MTTATQPVGGKWWHREGDRIVCDLCPRECRLGEGQRGFCFVRKNTGGAMALTTYGKSTGFCVDPIEKKPLLHFLPGTPVLSFGTAGCNLGCKFCQNWDISKSRETEILSQQAGPEAIVQLARESGSRSIAFTYNDPVIWAEYAIDTARLAREAGIKTVAVTAGYITEQARPEFFEWIDAANVDLKAFADQFYRKLAFAQLEPVLETLKWLKRETEVWVEITNLIIPTQNDSDEELRRLAQWVVKELGPDVPLHFSAFHPDFKMRDLPCTPPERLHRACEISQSEGVLYTYSGNISDRTFQNTNCPGCGALLIERDRYTLGEYRIRQGACPDCGRKVEGAFEDERGDWGSKRLPLRIREPEMVKSDFEPAEREELLRCARDLVGQVVRGEQPRIELDQRLGDARVFGIFTTLKRGNLLRGCIGNWSEDGSQNLGTLLTQSAVSAASRDQRFPGIHPEELECLEVELSPLFEPVVVAEQGADRCNAVQVGRHGLILEWKGRRGVLLPQVATERGWDAETFLEQICLKAGVPPGTWQRPGAVLKVFDGLHFSHQPPRRELTLGDLDGGLVERVSASFAGGAEDPGWKELRFDYWTGLLVATDKGQSFALREKGTLEELIADGKRMLQDLGSGPLRQLSLLTHALPLWPGDHPARHRQLAGNAVWIRTGEGRQLLHWNGNSRVDPVAGALKAGGIAPASWKRGEVAVTAFSTWSKVFPGTPARNRETVRRPWAAGRFYPGEPDALRTELDRCFAQALDGGDKVRAPAVMLPHAGWTYCGDIIAETLARVKVPPLVVVVGPKHTRRGPAWSVSAMDSWSLPGGDVPLATDLCRFLADHSPVLQRENEAHCEEHGTEVLLPFLQRVQPEFRLIPLAIGGGGLEDLQRFGATLSALRQEAGEELLLVISSDMNHFATEEENRRLDRLALDELEGRSPQGLFQVCEEQRISMCGMRPAVAVMQSLLDEGELSQVEITRYETSARVSGDRNRVVGYAGALFS